jgi:hypothetical protein
MALQAGGSEDLAPLPWARFVTRAPLAGRAAPTLVQGRTYGSHDSGIPCYANLAMLLHTSKQRTSGRDLGADGAPLELVTPDGQQPCHQHLPTHSICAAKDSAQPMPRLGAIHGTTRPQATRSSGCQGAAGPRTCRNLGNQGSGGEQLPADSPQHVAVQRHCSHSTPPPPPPVLRPAVGRHLAGLLQGASNPGTVSATAGVLAVPRACHAAAAVVTRCAAVTLRPQCQQPCGDRAQGCAGRHHLSRGAVAHANATPA